MPAYTFEDLRVNTLNKPFLSGRWGRAWQKTMGLAYDEQLDRLIQARRSRWPYYCPIDGLRFLGAERLLERPNTGELVEPEDFYRRRLRDAWSIWQRAGTQQAHVDAFSWCGIDVTKIYRRKEWNLPPVDGLSPYLQAFARNVWSQFDILVSPPVPWNLTYWGDFIWGEGIWGISATPEEIALLKRLVRRFKAAHDTAFYLVLNTQGATLWGTFNWGDGSLYTEDSAGTGVIRILIGEEHWSSRGIA